MVLGLVFTTACNPMDDIHDEIDAIENPVVGSAEYTLTDEDYEDLELGFGSFSSVDDAKAMIPGLLTDLYPVWGKGSSVLVGYDLYIGNAEGVSDYSGADIYQLTNSDYASTGSDAFGFYPKTDAASQIPDVLAAQITSPTEGQIILAKYKQYTEVPEVGLANIIDYNFAGSFEGWTIGEEFGDDAVWTSQSGYVQGNSYFGGQVANTEWLVSPSIDLTSESNLKFQITQELDYAGDASLLKIMVSTDYTDNVLTATWTEITLGTPASGTMGPSEDYDFSAYDGQTINVAFKYESTDTDAGRWRISNMAIKTLGATGDTDSKGQHFMYSGGVWEAVDGVYFMSSADFDSMGESSGQPGRYNNFGSSTPPGDYLPTFLSITYPYALEGDELFVIYDYFSSSSGAQIRGNLYTVIDGMWVGHESTISTTLQFGHDGTNWIPDNTIRYTLNAGDYDFIVSTYGAAYASQTSNMAQYGNFNGFSWTDDQILEVVGGVLLNNNPSAAEGQKYIVTYSIYDGSTHDEDISVILENGVYILY